MCVKKLPMRRRVIWFNFLRLMGACFVILVLVLAYIYQSSMSVAREQFLKVNEQKLEILNVTMDSTVSQMKRIAGALCVDSDAFLFFEGETPENADEGIWKRIASKLKTYSFGIDCIESIYLYSATHDRVICDSMSDDYSHGNATPMSIAVVKNMPGFDTGWFDFLPDMKENETLITFRAVNDSYPHVMTIIRNYRRLELNATVIINLNLRPLYSTVWTATSDDTQVFALDQMGRIVLSKGKTDLYEDRSEYPTLSNFELLKDQKSILVTTDDIPYTYTQVYNEKYQLYFVACTRLSEYITKVRQEQTKILVVFVGSMTVLGIMILLYCTISFQPLGHIMELLEDSHRWKREQNGSKYQIQEIVDKIVYYLQTNNDLRVALDDRLELLKVTQLQALQSQLDPHFIYNSLDAVNILVEEVEGEHGKIGWMVQCLVDILRYSLSGQELADLNTELHYLQKYAYIMRCRYGDCIDISFDFDENLMDALVPRLIFQPLIENSVFHGIMARNTRTGGKITISGCSVKHCFNDHGNEEDAVRVIVQDNGCGMRPERLEQLKNEIFDMDNISNDHIGVQNMVKRLYLLFQVRVQVDIQSEYDVGTCITIVFPKKQAE